MTDKELSWEYAVFNVTEPDRPWRDAFPGEEGLKICKNWIEGGADLGIPAHLFRIRRRKVAEWEDFDE